MKITAPWLIFYSVGQYTYRDNFVPYLPLQGAY